ncbi:MAG: hypothetical protein ACQEQI_00295 [Bacillota bacterium]
MKKLVLLIIVLSITMSLIGCNSNQTTTPSEEIVSSATPKINFDYSVLKKWEPNPGSESLGIKILVKEPLSQVDKKELINFVRAVSVDKDYAIVEIYSSQAAYQAAQKSKKNTAYKKGFILSSIKDVTDGNSRYQINWQQEKGKFSDLFQSTTILN